jgi:hypothetical protein
MTKTLTPVASQPIPDVVEPGMPDVYLYEHADSFGPYAVIETRYIGERGYDYGVEYRLRHFVDGSYRLYSIVHDSAYMRQRTGTAWVDRAASLMRQSFAAPADAWSAVEAAWAPFGETLRSEVR